MKSMTSALTAGIMAIGFALAVAAHAAELPEQTTWSAHGETSSGYAQSVAIGRMLKRYYGTRLRVLTGKDDTTRLAYLRDEEADYCACTIASYFSQEGVFIFADKDWGPQPVRLLMTNFGSVGLSLATAANAGIKTIADLKGKRVAWIKNAPAWNWNVSAYLAFAGLTWRDVAKVEVSSLKHLFDALINDDADAGFSSTIAAGLNKLAASPRGLYWPPVPHDDKIGWDRMLAAAPIYNKVKATVGSAIDKTKPPELSNYPYPVLITKAERDADEVYELVKAMVIHHADYENEAAGAGGWKIGAQPMTWAIPYHDGAIRYWREAGLWTPEAQAHNDRLITRQGAIKMAWDAMADKDDLDRETLRTRWYKARAAALRKAGFDPVFN